MKLISCVVYLLCIISSVVGLYFVYDYIHTQYKDEPVAQSVVLDAHNAVLNAIDTTVIDSVAPIIDTVSSSSIVESSSSDASQQYDKLPTETRQLVDRSIKHALDSIAIAHLSEFYDEWENVKKVNHYYGCHNDVLTAKPTDVKDSNGLLVNGVSLQLVRCNTQHHRLPKQIGDFTLAKEYNWALYERKWQIHVTKLDSNK